MYYNKICRNDLRFQGGNIVAIETRVSLVYRVDNLRERDLLGGLLSAIPEPEPIGGVEWNKFTRLEVGIMRPFGFKAEEDFGLNLEAEESIQGILSPVRVTIDGLKTHVLQRGGLLAATFSDETLEELAVVRTTLLDVLFDMGAPVDPLRDASPADLPLLMARYSKQILKPQIPATLEDGDRETSESDELIVAKGALTTALQHAEQELELAELLPITVNATPRINVNNPSGTIAITTIAKD
jgi:hypothetical protein